MTAKPAMPPTTPPTTCGVLGPGTVPELASESDAELDVAREPGAVPVPVRLAAAPPTVPPVVDWTTEVAVPVNEVAVSDAEITLLLPVRLERVLVVSVVLVYEILTVGADGEGVVISEVSEETSGVVDDSSDGEGDGVVTGVEIESVVKEVSDGAGEGGGEERID